MVKVRHRLEGKDYLNVIKGMVIKHKDYFSMKSLYKQMHDWLVEKGYAPESDANFPEAYYHHRFTQQGGEEIRFRWYLEKPVNFFILYEVDITARVLGLKSAEVLRNGVKFKSNHAEIELSVSARLVFDPSKKFRSHWLTKHFYTLFRDRLYKDRIDYNRKQLMGDMNEFREFVKTVFKIKAYQPEIEGQRFYETKDFE